MSLTVYPYETHIADVMPRESLLSLSMVSTLHRRAENEIDAARVFWGRF